MPATPGAPDDREDLTLFMPTAYREQIHAQALRLEVGDSAVLAAAWVAAKDSLAASAVAPTLSAGRSERVYCYVSRRIQSEVAAVAKAHDRSLSWVFLKAWAMTRSEVEAIGSQDQFHAWVRRNRDRSRE